MKARVVALVVLAAAVILTTVAAASPAYTAGARQPSYRLAPNEHIEHGWFPSKGKRGSFTVELRFGSSGTRNWRFRPKATFDPQLNSVTGQYAQITGGGGGRFPAGGHQAAWYARLFGTSCSGRFGSSRAASSASHSARRSIARWKRTWAWG